MKQQNTFDVIVIGGGHAGTEASLAAARIGARTLLITQSIETIGQMSCNPAIGGIGKGHLVKEVDALGGAMARAADYAGIQFRTLNARKGPAVRATRAQADRVLYKQAIRRLVEREDNLALFQQPVADLVVENDRITGVVTEMGVTFYAPAVVLTVGTFLGGRIHVGEKNFSGGRAGDPASNVLANRLRERPFRVSRLKTGTPPRIDGRTIDYSQLDEQPGEIPAPSFSFASNGSEHPRQVSCHLAYTNTRTHELIRAALHRSAMFSGNIEGVGPRYCPSIEDKIVRFADKDRHQVFVEPEGLDTNEIYPNGISTSLPLEVQVEFVRSIAGFGNAQVTRPGYAIEYDFFDPRDLKHSLETKHIAGLYFAGQINGTTGYEEAAAQGLVAGTNAARQVAGKDAWWPRRDEAYIGVLIDDLVTQGTLEPYRMFTSRAEYRLILREDNADQRLTPAGRKLGLIDDARWARFETKRDAIATETARLTGITVRPETLDENTRSRIGGLSQPVPAIELLRRPGVSYTDLIAIANVAEPVNDARVAEQVEVDARYAGYIKRQHDEIERQRRHETTELPAAIDYADVHGLSHEVRQKLIDLRPSTIGQAGRIPGVTPAAISLLLVHLKKRNGLKTRRKTA